MNAIAYQAMTKGQKIAALSAAILFLRKTSPANFSDWSWNKSREFSECYAAFSKVRSVEKCEISALRFASFYGVHTLDELLAGEAVAA
ncbi:hypothetical protein HUU62_04300 [Rhodoferax sp. 4810]|nr:hypothetical protein [Rhodoferax jenense]